MQSSTFTHLSCDGLNGNGLIVQLIQHVIGDIFRARIGRDSLAEGLNGVKAEKERLQR